MFRIFCIRLREEAQGGGDLTENCSHARSGACDRLKIDPYRTLRSGLLNVEPAFGQMRVGRVAGCYWSAFRVGCVTKHPCLANGTMKGSCSVDLPVPNRRWSQWRDSRPLLMHEV